MSAQHALSSEPDLFTIQIMQVPDLSPPDDWDDLPACPSPAQETAPAAGTADGGQGWPCQFATALAETLAGARPVRQIQPWLSRRGSIHLHRVLPLFAGGHPPRVQRVLTAWLSPEVIEMTMIVATGPRTRALAIRLELSGPAQRDGAAPAVRWVCTDIETA